MPQQTKDLNQRLFDLFVGHDIVCAVENGGIAFPEAAGLKLWGEFSNPSDDKVRLDINVLLDDGRTLVESFVGIANNSQSAEKNAFQYFCQADFHVLLNTLFGQCAHDDQVVREEWTLAGTERTVLCGNAIPRQVGSAELAYEWFQDLQSVVKAAKLDNRMHWLRLFYAQKNGQPIVQELLLDNEPWQPHQAQVQQWKWTPAPEFYSIRMFMTILPVDEPTADESTTDETTVAAPAADEPTVDEPTADEITVAKPTADEKEQEA